MISSLMRIISSRFKQKTAKEKTYYILLTREQRSYLLFLDNSQNKKYWLKKCELKIGCDYTKMYGTKPNLLKMVDFLRCEMGLSGFQVYIECEEV